MAEFAIVENGVPRLLGSNETIVVPAVGGAYQIAAGEVAKWSESDRNAISIYTIGQGATPGLTSSKRRGKSELRYDQPSNTVRRRDTLENYPLGERKQAMRAAATAKCNQQIAAGFTYDFGPSFGGVQSLDTGSEDARRWANYRNACDDAFASGLAMDLPIRTSANVSLLVSPTVGKAAMVAMAQREGAILKRLWEIEDQIRAAADHAALDAIDFSSGWPT
jgi:hypothetical protein